MANVNTVAISGNLTRDAELRQTQGGNSICRFSVAVNDRRKNGDSWEDYANYIDCIVFGRYGEAMSGYLARGTKVCVSGKLHWSSWEKDGQKRSKVEIIADHLDILSQKRESAPVTYSTPSPAPSAGASSDIPF